MKSLTLSHSAQDSMKTYGKSFYFASMVFNKSTAKKVFLLYQYCRYVDDCADELGEAESKVKLKELSECLEDPANCNNTYLKSLVSELLSYGIPSKELMTLLDGALFDSNGNKISNETEFIDYCYMVAGVVGKMMTPIIGVDHNNAKYFAIDLGIAMQITNICRDVLEDFKNNRIYLYQLKLNTNDESGLNTKYNRNVIKDYIHLSESYYKSAFNGLKYIPLRSRFTILVASDVYRAIGKKIKKKGYSIVFKQRVYLTTFEKVYVSLMSVFKMLNPKFWFIKKAHDSRLHQSLSSKFKEV